MTGNDLSKEEEKETTTALIKGVLAELKERGYAVGGFQAYITSDVLIGAGLSSSAAFETVIGQLFSIYIMMARLMQSQSQLSDSMQRMCISESLAD